ncbi:hypothetical protein F5Y18DRAFT_418014 [Xylariaceae sp. FL1019]|nr:hypothetical protein F5Y18DRAFT_418014 [Xylariaceae sp. FL1019]
MSGGAWKGIVKNGWHPETGDGSIRGQVKGLLGRGDSSSSAREEHVAMPISSLRDPSSFGPPPKRVGTYGNTATNTPLTQPTATPSSTSVPAANYAQSPDSYTQSPTYGTGQQQHYQQPAAEEEKPEPKPYYTDTTGLSTAHLPPPPMRRDGADGRDPQSWAQGPPPKATAAAPIAKKPPPSLPPRLPARGTASTPTAARDTAPVATGGGQLNQGAVDRLGAAGISVPGFGIGATKAPSSPVKGSAAPAPVQGQVNELQARFARMDTSSAPTPPSVARKQKPPPPPASKKPTVPGLGGNSDAPPPVPLASKPKF